MPTLPFGLGKHSNRSHHGLDEAAAQREGASASQNSLTAATPNESDYDPRTQHFQYNSQQRPDQYSEQQYHTIDPRFHNQEAPTRSQSQRYSTPGYQQPTFAHDNRLSHLDEDDTLGNVHKSYSTSGPNPRTAQQQPQEKERKGRTKAFFGFASKHSKDRAEQGADLSTEDGHPDGLGRKLSKTSKNLPPGLQQRVQQGQLNYSHFSTQGSDIHLPSPQELDEIRDQRYQGDPGGFESSTSQQNYDHESYPAIRTGRTEQDGGRTLEDNRQYPPDQYSHQPQRTPASAEDNRNFFSSSQSALYQQSSQLYTNIPSSSQTPELISQLSRDSPIEGQGGPRNTLSAGQAQTGYSGTGSEYPSRTASVQERRPEQQGDMAPSLGSLNRRSTDAKAQLGGDARGQAQGYSQQFQSQGGPGPSAAAAASRPSGLRGELAQGSNEQGRGTPPPSDKNSDASELDKLMVKYKKVKGLYFEKNSQVEQLQNTLANQRLSQSRTSLDDNEYASRFLRLDGAIKEIAFSIRKDWKVIPAWLQPYVNADAQKTGTKEMTAVGRASISKWIHDEIFCKCFVPGLDPEFSADLKRMERNIRAFASPPTNAEEETALTSKIVQWKLTTIDSLADRLNGPDAAETRASYIRMAVSNLTAHLINHLAEPTPLGIEGNATSIIELAVSICTHLPKESREICITYPLPGEVVDENAMKIETGLPPLENPMSTVDDGEKMSVSSAEAEEDDKSAKARKKDDGKPVVKKEGKDGKESNRKDSTDGREKVRFAAFMGVEVKGRQWLVSAPVWTLG